MAGYSGTPLSRKLGLHQIHEAIILNSPKVYAEFFQPEDQEVIVNIKFHTRLKSPTEFIHYFVTSTAQLQRDAENLTKFLKPTGILWISWPKKSSANLTSDLTEQTLRDVLLPLGIVDVKVCAVDEDWSGLKFVWRKS